jgi:hypothetical protein
MDNAAAAVVARSCHRAVNTAISTTPPLPAFNPANRVDLIARTIVQLTQFRTIRRRRNAEIRESNEEARDVKQQNCELRKECEGGDGCQAKASGEGT